MSLLPKQSNGCPYLLLAPMEGVGDSVFRKAIASIGGFDEAVADFLRVPKNAHVQSLARRYSADELGSIPLAAQLMGSDPDLMALMAQAIEQKGAKRIEINCGCPSNTVTGRGAGSSLLKHPRFLFEVTKAVVEAVSVPVAVKMRSGYEDTSLFKENLLAAQESGACYLTLHPRTKLEGYTPPAKWELIAQAKEILDIPVVGNGDIVNVETALRMLSLTNCDALMIGRGSVINPFIFHEIQAHFSNRTYQPEWRELADYCQQYLVGMPEKMPKRTRVGKLKQLFGFLFKKNDRLLRMRRDMLRTQYEDPESLMQFALPRLQKGYE